MLIKLKELIAGITKKLKKYEWASYIKFTGLTLEVLFIVWVICSYFNVLAHNTLGDQTYRYWTFNFFNIFFNYK